MGETVADSGNEEGEDKTERISISWRRGGFHVYSCIEGFTGDSRCVFAMCPPCHLKRSEETEGKRGESAIATKERESRNRKEAAKTERGPKCNHELGNLKDETNANYLRRLGNKGKWLPDWCVICGKLF